MLRIIRLVILSIASVALGTTFIYSAYTKAFPIQTFEYTMVEFAHLPWWMAAIGARVFLGLEALIGVLLILNAYGKKNWVLKLSLFTLIAFSIYLLFLWATVGNDVNCGCFGDAIWMSPTSSLLKNAVMILITWLLLKFHPGFTQRWSRILSIIVLLAGMITPFIIFPMPPSEPSFLKKDKYQINLTDLYNPEKTTPPSVELRKGKHILAFMSLTCQHCKMAAYKMQLMKKDNPDISMFMVLNGDSSNLAPFWENTKAESIPHTMLLGRSFIELSGPSLPAIYWINDGWVEANSTYIDLNQSTIEEWMFSSKK